MEDMSKWLFPMKIRNILADSYYNKIDHPDSPDPSLSEILDLMDQAFMDEGFDPDYFMFWERHNLG